MDTRLPSDLDVAIVGAGISGCLLGRLLAETGNSVAILEQSYSIPRNQHFAGLVTLNDMRAAGIGQVERLPVREIITATVDDRLRLIPDRASLHGVFSVIHRDLLEVLRRDGQVRGAPVLADATVTDLVWLDGAVSGVIAGPERQQVSCKLIVLADESDPRLAEGANLRPDWPPTRLMHLGKERFIGTPGDIASRFEAGFDGVSCFHIRWSSAWGDPVEAWIVPSRESVTVGMNLLLEDEMASAHHVLEVLAELKALPEVGMLLSGLESSDVVTEVVPQGRGSHPPRLVTDGILVVGDVVGATNPLNRDGLSGNLAICTVAAAVIEGALRSGDVSALGLAAYQEFLDETVFRPRRGRLGRRFTSRGFLVPLAGDVTSTRKSETLQDRQRRPVTDVASAMRRISRRRSKT